MKNILFIMADQLAASFLHCYGSGVESTPTLDRLAGEGVRFDRCYASSPVCAPNRATLFTGRSPEIHGIVENNLVLQDDCPTVAHVLRHRGYRTAGFGKFHLTPMQQPHPSSLDYLGFDEAMITEDPKWGEYIDWIEREHPEHFETALAVAWGEPRQTPRANEDPRRRGAELKEIRQRILGRARADYPWQAYASPLPAELHQTTYITDRTLQSLEAHLTARPGQPFFYHVSYVDPHAPYDPPAPYATMYAPEEMPDPIPQTWRERGSRVLHDRSEWNNYRAIADDPAAIRQWRALYHGSLRFIDDQIARLVAFLKKRGLWEETILVFTTDHGDMMGDHDLIAKGCIPYDTGVRVPLIVAGGGVTPAVRDELACSLDFFPTFCDWADDEPDERPPLEGRSFAPLCRDERQAEPREEVRVSFGRVNSLITYDGWRITVIDEPEESSQLINLREDPREQRNLYYEPGYEEIRRKLLERLVLVHTYPRNVPQYRNLPRHAGRAKLPKGTDYYFDPGAPEYTGFRACYAPREGS